MRDLMKKVTTATMLVSATLLVSACGGSETANTTDTNMAEMNAMEPAMDGSMNDMTAVDATMGSDANMAMDNNMMGMDNGAMMSGDNMSSNMAGNAM